MSQPLSPADRKRLVVLFDLAIELPPAQREPFVDHECGANHFLKNELLRLLAADDGDDVVTNSKPIAPIQAGTMIGSYKLLEKVGEGGMGEVYAAEQLEPVVRRVALKVIKPGMDSRDIIARFEAERQALARMAHVNVAQVYDGGVTASGSPFFVMEYVAGEALQDFCNRRKLSTRERLELFLGVCEGVQHAHQKGIVHRDLKPSNLLVTLQDDRAIPKIIDFGVARATSGRLGERTLYTAVGQIIGTPDYMSPEQADPTGVEVDTRSDVYSLGVVLYELVSGLLPFELKLSATFPLSELQRVIREQAPPSPSTRLRRETKTATTIAPRHATDGSSLVRQLTGDLDWICLKALEKDPARRYASASELAADIRRHLGNQPILAGRPGTFYRARKFVARNRLAVAASFLVTIGIVAGLIGIVLGQFEADAAERLSQAMRPFAAAHRLRVLEQRADEELWPLDVQALDAMGAWRDEALKLATPFEGYEADLLLLRTAAQPYTPSENEYDRSTHARARDLIVAKSKLDRLEWDASQPSAAEQSVESKDLIAGRQEVADLSKEVDGRRTWTFETNKDQTMHDTLTELVNGMHELLEPTTGLLGNDEAVSPGRGWSISHRIAFVEKLEVGFAPGGVYANAWRDAREGIAASYPGLNLQPQMGLVPIGQNKNDGANLWEFAHLMTGEPAKRGADGQLILTDETGVVFVLLPGGEFKRGKKIQHKMQLSPFFMSKYEMTQGQWKRLTGSNPSLYGPDGKWEEQWLESGKPASYLHPVEQVSWHDCMKWLPRAGLQLPSEAQWERAARGGMAGNFWTGNLTTGLQGVANLADEYSSNNGGQNHENVAPINDGATMHQAVGFYRANALGLHDVHGNVYEWCLDELVRSAYGNRPQLDPVSPWAEGGVRVYRGGSYRIGGRPAQSWFRSYYPPSMAGHALGLRPAKVIEN